jgi:hypothetical protein
VDSEFIVELNPITELIVELLKNEKVTKAFTELITVKQLVILSRVISHSDPRRALN